MKIKNCQVSKSIEFFKERFINKWGLVDNYDKNEPLIMFGCYSPHDYKIALKHNNIVVIVWAGTDAMRLKTFPEFHNHKNIFHISGSEWIKQDLDNEGLRHKYIPITVIDNDKLNLQATPLGDKIYVYTSVLYHKNYGSEIFLEMIRYYGKDIFIVAQGISNPTDEQKEIINNFPCKLYNFNRQQLIEAYNDCFIGLRLVPHDGISETVVELGLLGRRVVNNGCEPNCLKYNTIDDIKKLIDREYLLRNQTFQGLSDKMKKHIDIGTYWLNVENYKIQQ